MILRRLDPYFNSPATQCPGIRPGVWLWGGETTARRYFEFCRPSVLPLWQFGVRHFALSPSERPWLVDSYDQWLNRMKVSENYTSTFLINVFLINCPSHGAKFIRMHQLGKVFVRPRLLIQLCSRSVWVCRCRSVLKPILLLSCRVLLTSVPCFS